MFDSIKDYINNILKRILVYFEREQKLKFRYFAEYSLNPMLNVIWDHVSNLRGNILNNMSRVMTGGGVGNLFRCGIKLPFNVYNLHFFIVFQRELVEYVHNNLYASRISVYKSDLTNLFRDKIKDSLAINKLDLEKNKSVVNSMLEYLTRTENEDLNVKNLKEHTDISMNPDPNYLDLIKRHCESLLDPTEENKRSVKIKEAENRLNFAVNEICSNMHLYSNINKKSFSVRMYKPYRNIKDANVNLNFSAELGFVVEPSAIRPNFDYLSRLKNLESLKSKMIDKIINVMDFYVYTISDIGKLFFKNRFESKLEDIGNLLKLSKTMTKDGRQLKTAQDLKAELKHNFNSKNEEVLEEILQFIKNFFKKKLEKGIKLIESDSDNRRILDLNPKDRAIIKLKDSDISSDKQIRDMARSTLKEIEERIGTISFEHDSRLTEGYYTRVWHSWKDAKKIKNNPLCDSIQKSIPLDQGEDERSIRNHFLRVNLGMWLHKLYKHRNDEHKAEDEDVYFNAYMTYIHSYNKMIDHFEGSYDEFSGQQFFCEHSDLNCLINPEAKTVERAIMSNTTNVGNRKIYVIIPDDKKFVPMIDLEDGLNKCYIGYTSQDTLDFTKDLSWRIKDKTPLLTSFSTSNEKHLKYDQPVLPKKIYQDGEFLNNDDYLKKFKDNHSRNVYLVVHNEDANRYALVNMMEDTTLSIIGFMMSNVLNINDSPADDFDIFVNSVSGNVGESENEEQEPRVPPSIEEKKAYLILQLLHRHSTDKISAKEMVSFLYGDSATNTAKVKIDEYVDVIFKALQLYQTGICLDTRKNKLDEMEDCLDKYICKNESEIYDMADYGTNLTTDPGKYEIKDYRTEGCYSVFLTLGTNLSIHSFSVGFNVSMFFDRLLEIFLFGRSFGSMIKLELNVGLHLF